jgi:hypothetical protein
MMWIFVPFLLLAPLTIHGDPACVTSASAASLAKRASPLDSVSFDFGGARVKVCYGRPSARGRTMIGGMNIPLGKLWRTGANEPTMVHTSGPITLAGIKLEPGTYSLYTIPEKDHWTIILNRSTVQWGDEGSYDGVKKEEVGRGTATVYGLKEHVEQFTIRHEAKKDWGALVLEWEKTKVVVPLK